MVEGYILGAIRKSLFLLVALSLLFICAACGRDNESRTALPTSSQLEQLAPSTPSVSSPTTGEDIATHEQPSSPTTMAPTNNEQPGSELPTDSRVPDTSQFPARTDNEQSGSVTPSVSDTPSESPSSTPNDSGQSGIVSPTDSVLPDAMQTPAPTDEGLAGTKSPEASSSPESSLSLPPTVSPEVNDDGAIVLTIRGDGVSGETTWTLEMLQSMRDGYRECTYSTTNNWPSFGYTSANGISLKYLLEQAGVPGSAAAFKFIAADGYYFTVTNDQVFGAQYSYSSHDASGSSGAMAVEPVIAWEWGDIGKVRPENLRVFFGQSGPWEVNTAAFVSNLIAIEVLADSPGAWEAPTASITDGSDIPAGTEFSFLHESMDRVRIYYTLDGSVPDYNSFVYNKSTSNFQPQLIVPLTITENVTIKAFAAGLGKDPSPVVTFSYTVED